MKVSKTFLTITARINLQDYWIESSCIICKEVEVYGGEPICYLCTHLKTKSGWSPSLHEPPVPQEVSKSSTISQREAFEATGPAVQAHSRDHQNQHTRPHTTIFLTTIQKPQGPSASCSVCSVWPTSSPAPPFQALPLSLGQVQTPLHPPSFLRIFSLSLVLTRIHVPWELPGDCSHGGGFSFLTWSERPAWFLLPLLVQHCPHFLWKLQIPWASRHANIPHLLSNCYGRSSPSLLVISRRL